MNCGKIQNLLSAYMDGELTGEEQLQISRHLEHCHQCSEEHASLLATKRMIASLTVRQPRPELEQMILGVLAEEEQSRVRRSPLVAWWLTMPLDRRLRFASVFAVCALSLAAARIVPVLLAPSKDQPRLELAVRTVPAQPRNISPVGDVIFIHNPSRNAPVSGGETAIPLNIREFTESGLR